MSALPITLAHSPRSPHALLVQCQSLLVASGQQLFAAHVTDAGIRRVHARSITSPRQVHDRLCRIQALTGDLGSPCGTTPPLPAGQLYRSSIPAAATGHSANASVGASKGWRGLIRQPAPAAGTNKTSLPPSASRTAKKPAARDAWHTPVRRAGWAPRVTGQTGHGSPKQAVPRTAPSARTLSAICP